MNHSMPLPPRLAPRRRPAALPAARRAAVYAAMLSTLCATWFTALPAQASSPSPYVGELMLFGGNFCPINWLPADGRTVNISEYDVLYALLGTTYGGDGQNTFQLPDLRGRAAVGQGAGPSLTPQTLGYRAGTENATLTQAFGINVPLLVTLTYGFGVALAAFAGVLAAPIYSVNPNMGADLIIVVFAVVVIGGMGSIMGAIVTGFSLGLVEGLTKVFYPEASATVIFIVMVLVLLVKPAGLFGRAA